MSCGTGGDVTKSNSPSPGLNPISLSNGSMEGVGWGGLAGDCGSGHRKT